MNTKMTIMMKLINLLVDVREHLLDWPIAEFERGQEPEVICELDMAMRA